MQERQKRLKKPIQKYNENLSEDQAIAKKIIDDNHITILSGLAGTGKTRLATQYALEKLALERKRGGVNKIFIARPTISEKEDNNGFLPGDITEKFDPWITPIKDAICEIEGNEIASKLLGNGKDNSTVQIVPMMYIQGRTLKDAVVIVDEAQNLSKGAMERVFTRLGTNSKMIFCGDLRQSLLLNKENGLSRLLSIENEVEGLGHAELTTNFRHEIVSKLLKIY